MLGWWDYHVLWFFSDFCLFWRNQIWPKALSSSIQNNIVKLRENHVTIEQWLKTPEMHPISHVLGHYFYTFRVSKLRQLISPWTISLKFYSKKQYFAWNLPYCLKKYPKFWTMGHFLPRHQLYINKCTNYFSLSALINYYST